MFVKGISILSIKLDTFEPFEETRRYGFPLTGRHPAVEVLPFDLEEFRVQRAAAALGISVDTTGLSMEAAESGYLAMACPFFACRPASGSRGTGSSIRSIRACVAWP